MAKIDIPAVPSGFATTTALNARFQQIEDEFNNKVLYRTDTGIEPNSMQDELDMGAHKVINLDDATQSKDAVNLGQIGPAIAAAAAALGAGTGNVLGAVSSTDGDVVSFSGTSGKLLKTATIPNYAAIGSIIVTSAGQQFFLKCHTVSGFGGGIFESVSGSVADDGGTQKNALGGFYLRRVNYKEATPEMFGVVPTDVTTDFTNQIKLMSVSQSNPELSGNINLSSATIIDIANGSFNGDYKILNQPRKFSTPRVAPSVTQFNDVIASLQLKQLNTNYKPKIAIIGDSLSTTFANDWGRGDMLSETLRMSFEAQFPAGVTWLNRAISGSGFGEVFTTNYAATSYLPWYQGMPATRWIDVVELDAPDVLIFAFGTNDNQYASVGTWVNMEAELATWATKPDVIVITNPVPNPGSTSPSEGITGQYARDMAAGLNRSFAKNRKWALVDVHRKFCMARDGFDPMSAVIKTPITVNPSGNICQGPEACAHWKIRAQFNATNVVNGDSFVVATGRGTADFIILSRINSTTMGISAYGGLIADNYAYIGTSFAFTWPASGNFYLTIERSGTQVMIYRDDDVNNGGYFPNSYSFDAIAMGGDYIPYIQASAANRLVSAQIGAGEYLRVKPTVKNNLLYNDPVYAGSGWNHPSGLHALNVLRPLIQNIIWKRPRVKRGTVSILAGASSATVTFPVAEPNTNWDVRMSFVAAPGSTFGLLSKSTSGFIVQIYPNLVFNTTLVWDLSFQNE